MTNVEPFRYEYQISVTHALLQSSRQNFTALCTTASQNLAAVGSSHSLTETVNLGSVATAGLIGTLHSLHLLFLQMLDSLKGYSGT